MTLRSEVSVPIGLMLALACGMLHAQAAGPEGKDNNVPRGQAEAQAAPPVLMEPGSLAGMNLDFTQGAKLGEVLLDLSKHSGVSIILHASASAQAFSTSADLRGMNFQQALDTLMLQSDLFYKVVEPKAIMVFKKTPQNLQEFETRVIKTIYLSHTDVETVRATCNALMPQLRVFVDRRLNALTLSGTASDFARAQQIVNNLDRARGEVSLQMELIEVSQKACAAAGILPRLGQPASQDPKALTPEQALALVRQDGESTLLASPKLRVISGETAEVRIGRKAALTEPPAGPKTPKSASGGKTEGTAKASQGEDLGVRIKVRPELHPDHDLTLQLEYEITDPLKAGHLGRANLSERVIKTSLRMKDGECAIFGGLLEDEERDHAPRAASGVKEKKDRLLVIKVVAIGRGEQ